MNRNNPFISIVTPSFNQGEFLEETILSVLHQDFPDMEYIVVDGGSTDSSLDIIRKYEDRLTCWVSEPDGGQSDAINKGWRMAKGEVLGWLNSDDTYCSGAIRKVAEIFSSHPEVMLVHGAAQTFSRDGQILLCTNNPYDMDPYDMIACCSGVSTQPSIFIRRSVLEEVGYLREDLHYVMDWEYWIRIGLHFGIHRFHKTNNILSCNRDWAGTKTNQGWSRICEENRRVLHDIFESHPLDPRIQAIKPAAYRSSYRKQAELARMNGRTKEALLSVFRAMMIEPLGHNPARDVVVLIYILLGMRMSEKLRNSLSPLRSKLNRLIGY